MIQQQRQSKNSSALGIIGGSIVSNNQSQSTPVDGAAAAQNPFGRQGQAMNKTGIMYNTMYGGVGHNGASSAQSQSQNGASGAGKATGPNQPIHIKIEDQTGIVGPGKMGGVQASSTNP